MASLVFGARAVSLLSTSVVLLSLNDASMFMSMSRQMTMRRMMRMDGWREGGTDGRTAGWMDDDDNDDGGFEEDDGDDDEEEEGDDEHSITHENNND